MRANPTPKPKGTDSHAPRHPARSLRRNQTDAERALWQHLRGKRFQGFKFRRQHPYGLYILDFVCLEARLVIELDGGQHQVARPTVRVMPGCTPKASRSCAFETTTS